MAKGNYRENINKDNNNIKNQTDDESTKIKSSELANYYISYTTKKLNYKDPTVRNIETITEFIKNKKMPSFIPMNSSIASFS